MDIAILILLAICIILQILLFIKNNKKEDEKKLNELKEDFNDEVRKTMMESSSSTQNMIKLLGDMLRDNQKEMNSVQNERLKEINQSISDKQEVQSNTISNSLGQLEKRFVSFETTNEQRLKDIRDEVEKKLTYLQADNNKKLDEMRVMVDEKLQTTLENKMTQSFQLVNDRLEQVYKGLGEMQNLATGVGDLKKVLSNVKTRGIVGEIQLGAILEEILAPEQYDKNCYPIPNSRNVVEYAVKLPGEDSNPVYLPIDSKFPGDAYLNLQNAYEIGDAAEIQNCINVLLSRIKAFAKDIHDKYIEPPYTTDFAIMFLPFEGLYAEVVRRGFVESLQRDYKINIAGPTTMAALLNSLQMGFKTLAIQKRSSEVWDVLGAVKSEFEKFGTVLENTQNKLNMAQKELDNLVGVRTRQIQKKLDKVSSLDQDKSEKILEISQANDSTL